MLQMRHPCQAAIRGEDAMLGKPTVLIVDDSAQLCESLKQNLEYHHGFTVLTAQNGADGVRLARQNAPDAIVLDVMMPGMSGGQVAETLREHPGTADTPIVFLTGMLSKEEVDENAGFIGSERFLAKPVSADELAAAIQGLLRPGARRSVRVAPQGETP